MRKSLIAVLVLGLVAAAGGRASADNVTVAVDNPGGSRTLYVENLLGQPLTNLDFGTTRAQPFRVRVVDSSMDRAGFTVAASMTNLYVESGGAIDFTKRIDSANVSISHPANPLNALNISGAVEPVFDSVSRITDLALCSTLSLTVTTGACTITMSALQGSRQVVPVVVNLSDLTNLPLLPQGSDPGAFTNPAYEGVAATAPQPSGAPAATARQMVKGTVVSTTAVLSALDTALASVLASQPLGSKVDTDTFYASLRSTLGVVYDTLSATQIQTIVDSTTATARALLPEQVKAQSGTYMSLPVLNVNVPSTAERGSYKGTLVVTGLQP